MSTPVFGTLSQIPSTNFQPRQISLGWKPAKALARPVGDKIGQQDEHSKILTVATLGLPMAVAAATSFVGFRLGSTDSGIPKALGYMVGLAGAGAAIWLIMGMMGLAEAPFNLNR